MTIKARTGRTSSGVQQVRFRPDPLSPPGTRRLASTTSPTPNAMTRPATSHRSSGEAPSSLAAASPRAVAATFGSAAIHRPAMLAGSMLAMYRNLAADAAHVAWIATQIRHSAPPHLEDRSMLSRTSSIDRGSMPRSAKPGVPGETTVSTSINSTWFRVTGAPGTNSPAQARACQTANGIGIRIRPHIRTTRNRLKQLFIRIDARATALDGQSFRLCPLKQPCHGFADIFHIGRLQPRPAASEHRIHGQTSAAA